MAISGRKPKPVALKLITGNPGRRPLPQLRQDGAEQHKGGPIERPPKLKNRAGELWNMFISRAHWLTWADGPKAAMWCHLQAEYDRGPKKMVSARIAQLRALGSELGFDVSSRDRMGIMLTTAVSLSDGKVDDTKAQTPPAHKYFD